MRPGVPRSLIFVHQYYAPELAGSAQQLTDLTRGLVERGYSVDVVTGQPSYSSRGKLPCRENHEGVRVYRVFKFQLARSGALGRVLSAVSFFVSSLICLFSMDPKALLVIGSDPPFLASLGWIFRKLRRQDFVLVYSDIYPDIAVSLGELKPRGWVSLVLEGIHRKASREARRIVVLGERMKERISERFLDGKGTDKIEVIHNWANENEIDPVEGVQNRFRREHGLSDPLVLLFSGNLGKIYAFEEVLEVALLLKGEGIQFVFIGNGPLRARLESKGARHHLTNLRFFPYQPKVELRHSLTSGDIALLPLKREVTGLCVPGKFYWALAGGLPVLAVASKESEVCRVIEEHSCGWCFEPGQPEKVAELLRKIARDRFLLTDKARNARRCFEDRYTRKRALSEYEAVFSSV